MKRIKILLILAVFLFPSILYANCFNCCGSNCDCGNPLDYYCGEGSGCNCVSSNDICYYASNLDCNPPFDYWESSGVDCSSGACWVCGYDSVDSYYISDNTCYYGCNLECTKDIGWEKSGCFEQSLGSCCDCTKSGIQSNKDLCPPLKNCGGILGDCICQGCNLNTTGDQTLDFQCNLEGNHHLQSGSLTIASTGAMVMFANSTFTFDQGYSINLNNSGGYIHILMSEVNAEIIKN